MISVMHVGERIADGGAGGEHGELAGFVLGGGPMRQVGEPHDHGAEERADHLRGDVAGDGGPGKFADGGEADGNGGVEVRAAEGVDGIDTDNNGQGPAGRDDDPAAVVTFGFV
jgi:hypothetical protein